MTKGWNEPLEILGVSFAPLYLSWERRLQTLAATTHAIYVFVYSWPIFYLTFLTLIFMPFLIWIPIAYFTYCLIDKTPEQGGRDWTPARHWRFFRHSADFFPVRLIKTAELDAERNYIVGSHPHGILSHGAFASFATEARDISTTYPGLIWRVFGLKLQFYVPGAREILMWTGACAASKEGIEAAYKKHGKGLAGVIVIGGAAEVMNHSETEVRLVLKSRLGFVKIAIKNGIDLVPSFSFGENFIFNQVDNPKGSWLRTFQEKFKDIFGFSPVLVYGRGFFQYNFGIVPHRRPINVVVGSPIRVEKNDEPSHELVKQVHDKYIEELVKLYNTYNPKYGDKNVKLVID